MVKVLKMPKILQKIFDFFLLPFLFGPPPPRWLCEEKGRSVVPLVGVVSFSSVFWRYDDEGVSPTRRVTKPPASRA